MQGTNVGPQLEIPMGSNVRQMEELVNELLQNGKNRVPYSLFIGETEVTTSLKATVEELVSVCNCAVCLRDVADFLGGGAEIVDGDGVDHHVPATGGVPRASGDALQ
ncbi:unnamed protein product [Phytophthora lilii]|uniref:Unnamed protein product n=1 Tax=Phytophthora lilii TaxID=2077276 RepID=A0A9W6YJ80_9STRA|nr:unnamed protein product [Phytophthora lilii]